MLFPTRNSWEISDLEAQSLPLYWNKEWLKDELARTGSAYFLAKKWNYPWGEIKRLANHFGITSPTQRGWVGKYFMLEKQLLRQIAEVKPAHQSRNRWIVEALQAYLEEQKSQKKESPNLRQTD
jgi:Holliday junction resolvase-like predicted endonuclease